MKSILLLSILILSQTFIKAQELDVAKDSFVIKSFPTYDADGNYYSYTKKYDHLPTKEDSILFKIEMNEFFRRMMGWTAEV